MQSELNKIFAKTGSDGRYYIICPNWAAPSVVGKYVFSEKGMDFITSVEFDAEEPINATTAAGMEFWFAVDIEQMKFLAGE